MRTRTLRFSAAASLVASTAASAFLSLSFAAGEQSTQENCIDVKGAYFAFANERVPLYERPDLNSGVLTVIPAESSMCAIEVAGDFAKVHMFKNFRHWGFISDVSDQEFGWAHVNDLGGEKWEINEQSE